VEDPQYVGRNTYWIIGASFGSNDILNFSLLLPTIHIDPVYAETDYSRATFKITISRLDACPRPYNNVFLSSTKIITFTNFDYVIINRTGGISENITSTTEFQYHLVPAGSGSNALYFSLNLGSIRNKTDYEFTLIIYPVIIRNTFLDRWFLYFVVLPLGITVLAMLLHPYIWEWVLRKPQPRKPRNEDYLKKGLPLGLILSGIIIVVLYAINVAQGTLI
jgi:hypothetical protein